MSVTSSPIRMRVRGSESSIALAVADASWFTTENLFREVDRENVSTLLLKCMDFYNALQKGRAPWNWSHPLTQSGPELWRRELVMPSGWMKRFPKFGMRPISRSIEQWRRGLKRDTSLALVMTYPHYLYLRDMVRPDRTVYYNIDDYTHYWPGDADRVGELERQAVRESDLTVCVSRLRAEELRATVPEAASRIRHLPHGAPTSSLAEHPWKQPAPLPADLAHLPRPILGYVGTMEGRIDWGLLERIARAFPRCSVALVGKPPAKAARKPWRAAYQRCVQLPNVHFLGWRPQGSITLYNEAFDVCMIPYRVDHPFNRVCSPAKIMDYMATGRPIVSTGLPECLLYTDLFDVADSSDAFLAAIERILAQGSDDGRADARWDWARAHTCRKTADQLLDWLL